MRHLQGCPAWLLQRLLYAVMGHALLGSPANSHMSKSTAHMTGGCLLLSAFAGRQRSWSADVLPSDSRVWRLLLGLRDGSLRLKGCAILTVTQGAAWGCLEPVQSAQPAGIARGLRSCMRGHLTSYADSEMKPRCLP